MSEEKREPEREKGTAPPDYMPAIFGWMTIDDQMEHAREITDFMQDVNNSKKAHNADNVDKDNKNDKDNKIRQVSELDHRAVEKIEKLERELNEDRDSEEIILIAYSKI